MKKLLYLIIFFSNISFAQKSYYGYKSRSSSNENDKKINCDEALKILEDKGTYLSTSFGGYNSDAINKIMWYSYDDILFSIVYFKYANKRNYSSTKCYLYGGWKYEFNTYNNLKDSFENAKSKGDFFWENIDNAKIDCD
jgi:hypothetical protein